MKCFFKTVIAFVLILSIIMTGSVMPANASPMFDLRVGIEQVATLPLTSDSQESDIGGNVRDVAKDFAVRVLFETAMTVVVYVVQKYLIPWIPIPAPLLVRG